MSTQRNSLVARVTEAILDVPVDGYLRVGIDGVDGAGKSDFADELGTALVSAGATVVRASVDGFHHPPSVRYRQGRASPAGFCRGSYDYGRLTRLLLGPFSPGGDGRYVEAVYDVDAEQRVAPVVQAAPSGAILVFDGIFLHRPELVGYWDYSVFLHVEFSVSIPRGAGRGFGSPDPDDPSNRRYVLGQQIYLRECDPTRLASEVVDNNDLTEPQIV